jgi:fructokinase
METWVSGPALEADHTRVAGERLSAEEIARRAADGDGPAKQTLGRHASRLARGLATVVNIFDPTIIVIGGGLSRLGHLYETLPNLMGPHIFADRPHVTVRPPHWGDASGARGAARLWDHP